MCTCINFSGNLVLPSLVFLQVHFKNNALNGASIDLEGSAHSSGWVIADTFCLPFLGGGGGGNFIKYTKYTKEKPVLMLSDNHKGHISIPVLDLVKKVGFIC